MSLQRLSLIAGFGAVIGAQDTADCVDNHPSCSGWAAIGECARNPAYMLVSCRLSCVCSTPAPQTTLSPTPAATMAPQTQSPTPSPTPVATLPPAATPSPSPVATPSPATTSPTGTPTPAEIDIPTPEPSVGSCTDDFLTEMAGTDIAGELIDEMKCSIEECCDFCETAGGSCQGYVYLSYHEMCYLKTNIMGTYPKVGVTTYLKASLSSGNCDAFDEHFNSDLAGHLVGTYFAPTIDGCCGHCDNVTGCLGFSYVNQLCYLKSRSDDDYFGLFPKQGVVTRMRVSASGGDRRLATPWSIV